jgi:hypothetical protein
MNANDYKAGDKVYFGRGRGEKTLGEIVKVNPKRARVKTLEARGTNRDYSIGSVWNVPYSLLSPATAGKPSKRRPVKSTPAKRSLRASQFTVGDRVWWMSPRDGERKSGIVIRVSCKSVSVAANEHCAGYTRVYPGYLRFEGQAA